MPWIIAYSIGLLCGLWIGPLQLATHVIQNRQSGERKLQKGQDKQNIYIIWNGNFLCLSYPSATFALQHNGFVPREWLAAKGLLLLTVIIEVICGDWTTRCCLFIC